jgi:predicted N-acetyltransferase YhbS
LSELPAVERSAAEAFRGSAQPAVVDGQVSPESFYRPLQAQGLVWVAAEGKQVVGFAACELFTDGLHLCELAVRHDTQRRGAGRALVAACVAEARRRRAAAVTLTTFGQIPWNAPFYARLGFEQLREEDLNRRLKSVLAREAERGLTDRCGMRLAL